MSVFDLKPLSQDAIEELKINTDDLWEIKIDENIYGPFETLSLIHYAKENKAIMSRALVSPMSVDNWRPFPEAREFIHETHYEGPFWILSSGQKSPALSISEVAKRIELGTIKRHDEISEDDGRHWVRIAAHPGFEAHFTAASSLPEVPQEVSFQKAKIRVLEQLEAKREMTDEKENIAELTHVSFVHQEKAKTIHLEEIKIKEPENDSPSFWQHFRTHSMWVTPVLALFVYFSFFNSKPEPIVASAEIEAPTVKQKLRPGRSKKDSWTRTPAASTPGQFYQRSPVTQLPSMDDNYPTVIETHQDEPVYPDPDKEAEQIAEIQDQENKQENSLVEQAPVRDPAQEGESLDATMNNEPQEQPNPAIDPPVVEEVSDF